MVSSQPYNIYVSTTCFAAQDAYVEPLRNGKHPYIISEILQLSLEWAKDNGINKVNIISNTNLLHQVKQQDYFQRNLFPYFIDINFHEVSPEVLEQNIMAIKTSFVEKENITHEFLRIQKQISHNKTIKRINVLKKGG